MVFSSFALKAPKLPKPLFLFVIPNISHCLCRSLCVCVPHTVRGSVHTAYFPELPRLSKPSLWHVCFCQRGQPHYHCLPHLQEVCFPSLSHNHPSKCLLVTCVCLIYTIRCLFFAFCSWSCHPLPTAQDSGQAAPLPEWLLASPCTQAENIHFVL